MSEASLEQTVAEAVPVVPLVRRPTMKDLIGEESLIGWFRSVREGLRQSKNSGEYRYAVQQVWRLWSPVCGILMPLLLVALMMTLSEHTVTATDSIPFTIEAQKVVDALKEDLATPPPELIAPPPMDESVRPEVNDETALSSANALPGPVGTAAAAGVSSAAQFSPQPTAFDTVALVKSPIKMKGIFASRSPGLRGQALSSFGGDKFTEEAVMRALRWIKTQQRPDGGWSGQSEGTGSTGFAILAYLAHDEIPGRSEEFGLTVQRAVEFLLHQENHDPMATHALAEAYGMTLNPNVKEVAMKSLTGLVNRLRVTKWGPGRDGDGTTRPDLLGMTFNVMALRSAQFSHIKIDGMDDTLKKLKEGFIL